MEDEQVKQLAETLKKNGLAVSMYEAVEKAKSILNVKTQKSNDSHEKGQPFSGQEIRNEQVMPYLDLGIKNENATLNELMRELNVDPEQVAAQEQERISDIKAEINNVKEEIREAEENPEKIGQVMKEVEKIKDDADKIIEEKTEEEPKESENQPQDDIFEEEKKVNLAKLFSNKK